MKILITGATGCLGHALVPRLAADGHKVVAVVSPGGAETGVAGAAETIGIDLGAPFDTGKLPSACDVVVHAAQSRRYRDFPDAAEHVVQINTVATHTLARYALRTGAKQFIYLSTGSVYVPHPDPIDEQGEVAPNTLYPASKLAGEALLAPYASHLTILVLRLFYMYGPKQQRMLVTQLAESIGQGKAVTLQGDGGIRLTPTFSGDVAQICSQSIADSWQGTVNVSSPKSASLRELATEIGRVVGKEPAFEQRAGNAPVPVIPDVTKLGSLYDMSSMTDLPTGLRQTFATKLAN